MFTAAQMQLIRDNCLEDFESLLRELSVSVDWSGDEYRAYKKIDDELSRKLSARLKSKSVTSGYTSLLKLGDLPYSYNETDSELLSKIIANRNRILRGLEKTSESVIIDTPPPQVQEPLNQSKVIEQTRMETVTREEHIMLREPIILGVVVIVVGLIAMFVFGKKIGGSIVALFGLVSAIIGLRGKNVQITKTVPVRETIFVPQPVVRQPVQKSAPVREEKKPPFTRQELQKILDVLEQVDKIVRAIC